MMMLKSYFARFCLAAKKESRKGGTLSSSQGEEATLEYLKESRVLSKGQGKVSKSSVERDVLVWMHRSTLSSVSHCYPRTARASVRNQRKRNLFCCCLFVFLFMERID